MLITEELLEKNGFTANGKIKGYYEKYVGGCASVTFNKMPDTEYSNWGRNWDCHIDNDEFESIGNAEVDTVQQFKSLCDCLEIDSKSFIE